MNKNIVGIQLGVTFSRLAFINRFNEVEVFTFKDGEKRVPSFVTILKDETVLVGQEAYDQYTLKVDEPIKVYKWIMSFEHFLSTNIYESPLAIGQRLIDIRPLTTKMSVKYILEFMTKSFETKYGKIDELMISVPDFFSIEQKEAVELATKEIGLPLIEVISESLAASIAYTTEYRNLGGLCLIFNLDYETYEVSVVDIKHFLLHLSEVEVLHSLGISNFGIEDFDFALVEDINKTHAEKYNDAYLYDDKNEEEVEFLMTQAAEFRKILYTSTYLKKNIFSSYGNYYYEIDLQRYNEIIKPCLKKIHNINIDLLFYLKIKPEDIRHILVVNKNPQIKYLEAYFQKFFFNRLITINNSDEVIIRGLTYECQRRLDERKNKEKK